MRKAATKAKVKKPRKATIKKIIKIITIKKPRKTKKIEEIK